MEKETQLQEIFRLHRNCSARFGGHVLRLLLESGNGNYNVAFSPVRLQAVLVLLANWTTPEKRKRILDMAISEVISLDEANILFDFANINPVPYKDYIMKDEEGNSISLVPTLEQQTTLWHNKDMAVKKKTVEKVMSAFNISVKAVDFADEKTKVLIDKDVCNATHGLIPHLDTVIDASILALIVDILYFKGSWENKFDDGNTTDRIFYGTNGKKKVPTMRRQGFMDYQETPVYQAVSLPYTCMSNNHKRFAMHIYLPVGKHTIADVLEEMWNDEYEFYSEREEVRLSLPRFEVSNKVDAKDILKNIGLSCILESNDIIPECIEGLQIADIAQQVKIKVDENGTEAAAVTFLPEPGCCPRDEKLSSKVMRVNKPFLFEIVEESTNTILFSGVINNID